MKHAVYHQTQQICIRIALCNLLGGDGVADMELVDHCEPCPTRECLLHRVSCPCLQHLLASEDSSWYILIGLRFPPPPTRLNPPTTYEHSYCGMCPKVRRPMALSTAKFSDVQPNASCNLREQLSPLESGRTAKSLSPWPPASVIRCDNIQTSLLNIRPSFLAT